LGIAYGNVGRAAEARRCIEKAMSLKDRIPERERYLIEAQFYMNRGERYFDRAIEAYSNYLKLYPEDFAWYNNLGGIYFRMEEWDRAMELFEQARKSGPANIIPLINSALKGGRGSQLSGATTYSRSRPTAGIRERQLPGSSSEPPCRCSQPENRVHPYGEA